jgi:ferritin
LINNTFKAGYLNSLMTAGADLELSYNDLAAHANERMAAALEMAKHAKETERRLRFTAISASTSGIKQLAEAGAGYVTFALVY